MVNTTYGWTWTCFDLIMSCLALYFCSVATANYMHTIHYAGLARYVIFLSKTLSHTFSLSFTNHLGWVHTCIRLSMVFESEEDLYVFGFCLLCFKMHSFIT